ncbi:MAG: response regulator transcription factor [Thermoleophilia bacterium]
MRGTTVLIVDDHAGFRDTARLLLETGGWRVVGEAGDGVQAIAAAREMRPDVVLVDVNLPGDDGFAVARAISGDPDPPAVVLTSSRDDAGYGALAGDAGARGFIPKLELSVDALRRLVAR